MFSTRRVSRGPLGRKSSNAMYQLKTWILIATVSASIVGLLSCKKESNPLIDSYNIIDIDENSLNHYHLMIAVASRSILQRSDPVTFSVDSVRIRLRILGFTSGTGIVRVLDSSNDPLFNSVISRDTTIADTVWNRQPTRVEIVFDRFSGGFEFEMN